MYPTNIEAKTIIANTETSETIGGFIIDLTGEIPKEKANHKPIEYENYIFTILSIKDRRIEKLKIEVLEKVSEDD